jgi:hypothetical protein
MQKAEHPKKNSEVVKEEFSTFDHAVTKIVGISHDELKKREAKWKAQQTRKRGAVNRRTTQ